MTTSTHAAAAALSTAATSALRAPSIFNTQPWTWRITDVVAELRVDRERQLPLVDPQGHLATISCGVALHHLRTALGAEGAQYDVARLPEPADPDLLARVSVTGHGAPDLAEVHHHGSLLIRRTDRRPFSSTPVPSETVDALRVAAEANGVHLHVIPPGEVPTLIVAADRAAGAETDDPAYRAEIEKWTHRPEGSGDGVPASTTVSDDVHRRVPVRDFTLGGAGGLDAGAGDDSGTTYAVLFAAADTPINWLRAGEALGAVLLAAVEHGASVSPMSDLVEVASTRQTLHRLLSGLGVPMIALRVGLVDPSEPVPASPRRAAADVIGVTDTGRQGA